MQFVVFNLNNTIFHIIFYLIFYKFFLRKNYTNVYISNYNTKLYLDDSIIKIYYCSTYNFRMILDIELLKKIDFNKKINSESKKTKHNTNILKQKIKLYLYGNFVRCYRIIIN